MRSWLNPFKSLRLPWLLLLILTAGLIIRAHFITGIIRADDLGYAYTAYKLSQGHLHLDQWVEGTSRIGLYGPVALLYRLFGASEAMTLAWPLAASLLSTFFLYGIGRLQMGEGAGLMAASLWMILPLDIFLATDLLPDGPMATFTVGSVFFFLLGGQLTGWKAIVSYTASGLSLLWALLIKPLSILLALFFMICLLYKPLRRWLAGLCDRVSIHPALWYGMLALLGIVAAAALYQYGHYQTVYYQPIVPLLALTARDGFDTLFVHNLQAFLAPLLLMAVIATLANVNGKTGIVLLWAAVLFVYYEWGSVHPNPRYYYPMNAYEDSRNILFVLPPLVALGGGYLAGDLPIRTVRIILAGMALFATGLAAAFRAPVVSALVSQIGPYSVLLAILFSALSPFMIYKTPRSIKAVFTATLLAFLVVAAYTSLGVYKTGYIREQEKSWNFQQAAAFLATQPSLPIYVANFQEGNLINYASGFRFGFDPFGEQGQGNRVQIMTQEPEGEGYLLVYGFGDPEPRPGWNLQAEFSQPVSIIQRQPMRLFVFKIVPLQ